MKNIIVCLLVWSAATASYAYDDSYMPKGHRLGEKYAYDLQNMYVAHSPNRAQTIEAPVNVTQFNYQTDGLWTYALGHSEIWGNGEPCMTFGGGNDVANVINVWFWSPSAGLRVINEEPYVGRQSFWTSVSKADDGSLYAIWVNTHVNPEGGTIFASKSLDSGKTWTPKIDVGALVTALDPNDTAMFYPKLAPRAIDGLHLIWLDDHKSPGSFIQNGGDCDTAFIMYAKINFSLDHVMGLDNGVNDPDSDRVVTMGWTAYDWATTGATQGCVIDDNQNMAAVWTRATAIPYGSGTRFIGYNAYMTGAGVGTQSEISPSTAGFPGIALATGGANGQVPLVVWHRANAIRCAIDQGGVGGGMWTSEATLSNGSTCMWPSCAHIGGTIVGDSIAAVGNNGTSYNGVSLVYHCDAGTPDRWLLIGDSSLSGTGVYDGIVASPNTPDLWVFFNGQSTRNAPPWAPTLHDTIHYPTVDSFGLYWDKHAYTNDGTDQWKLYHRQNTGGTWNVIATIDSIGSPATIVYIVTNPIGIDDTDHYYITAHDADGWGNPSNIISVSSQYWPHWPPNPPVLQKALHVPVSDSMELKWPRRYMTAGNVDYYRIYHQLNHGSWAVIATLDTATYRSDTLRYHLAIAINPSDTNRYAVTAHDNYGESSLSNTVDDRTPVGISAGPDAQRVSNFMLHQNSPNPAQGETRILFDLPRNGPFILQVYNVAGQKVAAFGGLGNAGVNFISWNLNNAQGHKVPNGVYVYQIYFAYDIRTRKMVILR